MEMKRAKKAKKAVKKRAKRIEETCAQKGYHEWECGPVGGTLPEQELELYCTVKGCTAETTVYFTYEGDGDGEDY